MNATAWWHDFSAPATGSVISAGIMWLITIIGLGGGLKCAWVRVYLQRVERAAAAGAAESAVAAEATAALQAVARLNDGPADVQRISHRILVTAARIMIVSTLGGMVAVPVLIAFGLPFGVITVPMLIGITVGGVACGDPTKPGFVRELVPFVAFAIGGWVSTAAGAAFCAVLDIAAMFPNATTASRVVFNGGFGLMAIAYLAMCLYGVPIILPRVSPLLARVGRSHSEYVKVLAEQRAALEANGQTRRSPLWDFMVTVSLFPIPAHVYLLDGAGFFEMPARTMIRRCLICARVAWLTTGVSLIAMSIAAQGSLSATFNWGGLFPTGLAFALLSFLCTPAGHRKIRSRLGGLGTVDDVQRRAVLIEFLSLLPDDDVVAPAHVV